MKLTKKKKEEILKIYDTWMHSYLNGDVQTYDSYFADEYHFIGSTDNEEFLNRKDTTQFFKDTAAQFSGKTDLRKQTTTIEAFDDLIFITHLFDAWFINGTDWTYYGRFRFTSVLQEKKEGWKFIYQHFSIADSKTDEGESIGFDKVNEENQELREAIKRRTVELEAKNRELEIEGALGRIRAQATAMAESSELLDIVVTMRNEFTKLGHEAHYFWHMMWLPETYEKAMTSGDGSKIGFVMKLPRHMHGDIPLLAKWEKSKKPTIVYAMTTKEAIDYVDKMVLLGDFQSIDPQAPSHDDLKHIGGLTFIMARTSHGEIGYSLPGIVKNPPAEDLEILVQFAGAFDLAHRRFLDLQKAEQQARETQIELALEKVRSRTMAMQHSDELQETSFLLDQQVRALGIKTWGCAFNIYGENESTEWFGNEAGVLPTYTVPRKGIFKKYYQKGQKGESLHIQEFSGDECVAHYEYMSSLPVIGNVLKKLKKTNKGFPTYQIDHVVYFKYGYLLFITKEDVPEEHDVFKRFAKVFEQTYTRFLDLQKAEAQAREAQIETVLERVRSQSMGMQSTHDFGAVTTEMFNQLRILGEDLFATGIVFCDKHEGQVEQWHSIPNGGMLSPFIVPVDLDYIHQYRYDQWKKGEELFSIEIPSDFIEQHFEDIFNLPSAQVALKDLESRNAPMPAAPPWEIDYGASFKNGYILASSLQHFENIDILPRFAKVFEQAYTRFLDLQKAEEQRREAQIEVALERVRSQSMAMHKSEELKDVVKVIFDQMAQLKINAEHAGIVVDYKPKKDWHFWVAEARDIPAKISVPYTDSIWDKQFTEAKKKGNDFFTTRLNFEEKNEFYKELLPHIEGITQEMQDHYFKRAGLAISTVIQKDIGLYIENFSGTPYTDKENKILMRFGKVFQQTYTRFLDLKKAEAQAIEAQIETALERVRSRTMAMQNSKELEEVILEVLKKLQDLGISMKHRATALFTYEAGNKDYKQWVASPEYNSILSFNTPYFDHPVQNDIWDARQNGKEFYAKSYTVEEKNSLFKYLFNLPALKNMPKAEKTKALKFKFYSISIAFQKHAALVVVDHSGIPLTEAENSILNRLNKVFNQTYTRFLDLKKAEAQTREGQIEVAIERIRAQSMAMHHPDDLENVNSEIYKQLQLLNINGLTGVSIWLIAENNFVKIWDLSSPGHMGNPNSYSVAYDAKKYDILGEPIRFLKKSKEDYFVFHYPLKKLQKAIKEWTLVDSNIANTFKNAVKTGKLTQQWNPLARHSNGLLSIDLVEPPNEDTKTIVTKITAAFNQAYIRFLDLQKAEAQTREAQIEAALERTRTQSMLMQHSDELNVTAQVFHQQLQLLGIDSEFSYLWLPDDGEKTHKFWATWSDTKKDKTIYNNKTVSYPLDKNEPSIAACYVAWESEETVHVNPVLPDKVEDYFNTWSELLNGVDKFKPELFPNGLYYVDAYMKYGCFGIMIKRQLDEDEKNILSRFSKEFQRTYTRFLDLQKAESQTRQAQLNLAVERVRAKALAMHKSEEIMEVVAKLKDEVMALDIPDVIAATIFLKEGEDQVRMWDLSSLEEDNNGYEVPFDITFKLKKKDPNLYVKRVWENPENYFVELQKEKDFKRIIAWLRENNKLKIADEVEEFTKKTNLKCLYHAVKKLKNGKLAIDLLNQPSEEMETILTKMGGAFDLAYKRFEDLQKAEAQTKEAKIETALEKVRSRSMAMHKSEELLNVITVVSEQLQQLNFKFIHVSFVNNNMLQDYKFWTASPGMSKPMRFTTPYLDIAVFNNLREAQKKALPFCTDIVTKEEHNQWHQHLLNHVGSKVFSKEDNEFIMSRGMARSIAINPNIILILANYASIPYSEEENKIIARFGQVFEQSYTRFLDLKKAEAQSRESQIEVALEKVRSRTMAMQKGEEVKDVVVLLYKELIALGVTNFASCGYVEINEKTNRQETWVTSPGGDSLGLFYLPLTGDVHFDARYEAWKSKQTVFHQTVAGLERKNHLEYAITTFNSKEAEEMVLTQFPDPTVFYCFNFSHGYLHLVCGSQLSKDEEALLARFTRVFEQTYARFLDLKKAEAQAREAQIENALEKVRSRSLAMHKPNELQEVITVVAEKLQELGVIFDVGGVILCTYFPDNKDVVHWIASPDLSSSQSYYVPYFDNPIFSESWDSKNRGDAYFSKEFSVEEKNDFFKQAFENSDYRHFPEDYKQHVLEADHHALSAAWSKNSAILIPSLTGVVPSESDAEILKRFAKVFEQAYIRFMDLQKAEAQARESQIEAALEKVRSRTMAMQHSDELPEAANNLFLQVQDLGIPAWSAGYCIWEKDQKSALCHMSSEGEVQKAFSLPTIGEGYNFYDPYKNGESFHVSECGGNDLVKHYDFMKTLPTVGVIFEELEKAGLSLPTFQIFHIVFFKFGYVMFITYETVPNAHHIFKRFGQVFEQTYTRFLDLKLKEDQAVKLEAEKKRLEKTLKDLQQTQKQLIQSEKMASLGELTAGIAHEIQNPLNFVNNFSEVSKELLEEMMEEMQKGDVEEVKALAEDIIQNLEKINHHGKRADGIVKGMLQHSRTSSGEKELTDINVLADEYFRLAYHGLRAQDKSFNAAMKTDFEENIDKINIIPQDIGRVILNLITNAFYVVDEKSSSAKASGDTKYEPTVSVSTKKINGKIEIKITDNGDGIPKKVLAKIFQPFFTTKPTGQGTGLGLSLSYDIVKAHGGELKVETNEGEGSQFIIILPV